MKRIILFIIISMNLSAFEIKDNIGIFDENSKRIAYPPNGDGNTEQTPVMPLELSTKK